VARRDFVRPEFVVQRCDDAFDFGVTGGHLDQEFEQRLVDLVRRRGQDTTIAQAVEREARRFLGVLLKSMPKPAGIPVSVALGAALRRV
jgi:hypothetical protein